MSSSINVSMRAKDFIYSTRQSTHSEKQPGVFSRITSIANEM